MDDDDLLTTARRHAQATTDSLSAVVGQFDAGFVSAVRAVEAATGRVVTTAVGTSGAVAARLAHLLCVCGTPAFHLDAGAARHGSLGALTAGDVLIAVSKTGRTDEVLDVCRAAVERGVVVVALTSARDGDLAALAHHVVVIEADGGDPGGLVAMSSTLAFAVWGDALAATLMAGAGHTMADVVAVHPGGSVGRTAHLGLG